MYERDAPLPADERWMSHALHISIRAWRKARIVLLRHGKLVILQDGFTNSRADEERLKRRSNALQNQMNARSSGHQTREKSKNPNENNQTPERTQERNEPYARRATQSPDSRVQKESSVVRNADAPGFDPHELFEKLSEAASGALYPLALSLQSVGEPLSWLREGADLDLDVVPVVGALARRARPQSIRSWGYFAGAVADAKARRERGLPNPQIADGPDAMKNLREILARKPQEANHG
jgi:uncharacterized protein YdaU (DUF1376 family)